MATSEVRESVGHDDCDFEDERWWMRDQRGCFRQSKAGVAGIEEDELSKFILDALEGMSQRVAGL